MTKNVSCLSIDVINHDKPPASLAFLAGACEAANVNYQAISLNARLLNDLSPNDYNHVYASVKLNKTDLLELVIDSTVDKIFKDITEFNTDIILVSVFSYMQNYLAKTILKKLKHCMPDVEIIAGGPGIQYAGPDGITLGKQLLNEGSIDYYCLGEGDVLLPQFLSGQRDMIGLNSNSERYESWVPQLSDLDKDYLLPSYKKIPVKAYKNLEQKDSTIISISTSRGCVRSCAFCDIKKSWPKFRFRSGKAVAQEILKHHQDVGAVNFTIVDSLINGSLKSFRDFNKEIVELKKQYPALADFSYNGMFIVRDAHSHPEELFQLMKEAGCESLAIGVETGSDRLRFEMDKKFTNRDLDHHLEMCQRVGIRNTLLTFVGYPTETEEDFEQSLSMLERYQKYLIDNTIIGVNHSGVYSILVDTPLYDQKDELGLVIDAANAHNVLNWYNPSNPGLTVKERARRDLEFRRKALSLRYPVPYATRYLEYLTRLDKNVILQSD